MAPDCFHGIEVRRVAGQPFHVQPLAARLAQLAPGGAVDAVAVPHEDDRAAQLAVQRAQEADHVRPTNVVGANLEEQTQPLPLRAEGDRGDGRKPIVSIPRVLDRCLAARRPGAAADRLQHEAAFVQEDNDSFTARALFLSAATPRGANARSRPRLARAPVAPAFGNSSPTAAAVATRARRDRSPRSVPESPVRPEGTSRDPWQSRTDTGHAKEFGPTCAVGGGSTVAWRPDAAWTSERCDPCAAGPAAIDSPPNVTRPAAGRPRSGPSFPSATSELLSSAVLPMRLLFLLVSCTILRITPPAYNWLRRTQ